MPSAAPSATVPGEAALELAARPAGILCPACRHEHPDAALGIWGDYSIHECMACGLVFCDPMKAASAEFYVANEGYDDKWEFDVVADKLKATMPPGSHILDIGCGDGRFLHKLLAEHHVRGIDFNSRVVEAARCRGIEAYASSLEDYCANHRGVAHDVVTLFHVLEHVADPPSFINEIKALLKTGGLLCASVPNVNRWTLRWARESWDYPPHHLTRWSARTLASFLEAQGFEVLSVEPEPVRRWTQVRSSILDLVNTVAIGKLSFRVVAELTTGSKPKSSRLRFAKLLAAAKTATVRATALIIAGVTYPAFAAWERQGKSLLVVARLK